MKILTKKKPGVSNRQLSELYKITLIRESKLLPNIFKNKKGGLINNFMPKRNFNSNIDRILSNLLNKIPQGNLGYILVGLNTLSYLLYLLWPRYQMYSYLNNFTFSKFNLSRGYIHTLFTCHFSHMSFLSYLIDTVIVYLFC